MSGAQARSQRRQAGQDEHQQHEQAPQPSTPGLDAVRAMAANAAATPAQIIPILRRYPRERDEILTWLHQHRGNAFVQQLTSQLGQIERAMPEGVELQSVEAGFMIPGGVRFQSDWRSTVQTRSPTYVHVEVSTAGVEIRCSPAIFVDVTWPGKNASISAAGVHFADGRPYANVRDEGGHVPGVMSATGTIQSTITGMLSSAIAGTPFARPGYQPTHDADLAGTLHRVQAGFQGLFAGGGHAAPSGLTPAQMSGVGMGATVATQGGDFTSNGTGVRLAPGASISVFAEGAATMQNLAEAGSAQNAVDAANVQEVRIETGGLTVVAKGKEVARLDRLTLHRGGRVTIDSLQLLGDAARARRTEGGLALLVAVIAQQSGRPDVAQGAVNYANNPQIVEGVSRSMIEREFTTQMHAMILQHRNAVPGVDLARALGIG
jgi:hypothetical protein